MLLVDHAGAGHACLIPSAHVAAGATVLVADGEVYATAAARVALVAAGVGTRPRSIGSAAVVAGADVVDASRENDQESQESAHPAQRSRELD